MLFKDRREAGEQLAKQLTAYKDDPNVVVIGLPRGGVVVAKVIAQALHSPVDIICARKIGAPYNPEFGVGAITETGESFLNQRMIDQLDIPKKYLETEIENQKQEAARRAALYKKNRPSINLEGKTVILTDDGIATGATMKAAIKAAKAKKAKKIIVAVPVAAPDTLHDLEKEGVLIIYLAAPAFFMAVGQFYDHFDQTTDQEVISLLEF